LLTSNVDLHQWFHVPFPQEYGIHVTCNNQETVQDSKIVVVAVKPHVVSSVLKEVSPVVTKEHLIVSIAAGVKIRSIEQVRRDSEQQEAFRQWPVESGQGKSPYAWWVAM
jgi:pyrroline-5-carboxylate reductase